MTERKLSPLVGKAETWLVNWRKRKALSIGQCENRWDEKRADYISALPEDIRNGLRAMHIIEEEGVDDGA